MTDNEILKALEYCSTDVRENTCPKCAFYKKHRCSTLMLNAVSDLINRQKVEIERLEHIHKGDEQLINSLNKCYKLAKSEAIKEFAERLKERRDLNQMCIAIVSKNEIDNLVKEMTEVEK